MSDDMHKGRNNFTGTEGRLSICDFLNSVSINNPDQLGPRRPTHENFDYSHGFPRGPPLPGMGIIVPGQPAPPFPRPPVVCRPSLPDGSHAPPLPPLPPHGPILHHPPPLPHPPHIPPPPMLPPAPHPHIPNVPIPPNNPYSVPPPTEAKSRRPPPPSTQRTDSTMHPPRSTQPRHCPPPLPGTQTTRPPPLPPNSFTVQPPLPPLPPLPPSPKVELSKPPPPNEPPPFIPVKKTREPSASPQSSKVEPFTKSSHSTKTGTPSTSKQSGTRRFFSSTPDIEHAKPIPSIVSSRPPAKPAVPHASNGNSRIPCPTVPPSITPYTIIQASTPPPPPLPPPDTVHPLIPPFMCSATTFEEEPYDPEEATFSPTSSDGSSPLEESAEDTLINKYVRKPSKLRSSENFSSSLKTPERIRCDNKKKKVSFSKEVSFSSKINKSQTESPARPNLDTRLKIMFGTVEEDASKKARKSLSHALSPNSKSENEVEEQERPLSPTPSPFVSRHMYLYWHKETIKARKASKLSSVDFVNSNTSTLSVKPQLNGQVLMSIPPLKGMPPLPKNLPTVPPPNYKSSLTEPFAIKEGSLKAELILKNINRMHPYKINDSKGYVLKNSLDSELELTSEAMPGESSDEEMSVVCENDDHENVTVNLVMAKIVEELKQVIREELTKKIVEKRVKVCLDKDKKC